MAIYNYGLPVNYQTPVPYQQQYPQMQQTVSQTPILANQNHSAGIIWVQGEAGAKAYPVAPGNSVLLMDSETECFYIKSTDASGIPMPLRIFSYNEVVQTQPTNQQEVKTESIDTSQFVTVDELNKLKQEFKQALDNLQASRQMRKENRNEQTIPRNSKQQPAE